MRYVDEAGAARDHHRRLPLTAWSRPYGWGSGGQEAYGEAPAEGNDFAPSCIRAAGVGCARLRRPALGRTDDRGRPCRRDRHPAHRSGRTPVHRRADQPRSPGAGPRRVPAGRDPGRTPAAASSHAGAPPPAGPATRRCAGLHRSFIRPKVARPIPGENSHRPYRAAGHTSASPGRTPRGPRTRVGARGAPATPSPDGTRNPQPAYPEPRRNPEPGTRVSGTRNPRIRELVSRDPPVP